MPAVSYAVILTRDVQRAHTAIRSLAAQTPDGEPLLVLNEPDAAMRAYANDLARDGARICMTRCGPTASASRRPRRWWLARRRPARP